MIHLLTLGHFAPGDPKTAAVERPLDAEAVGRLLAEMGGVDAAGTPTLGGMPVKVKDGVVALSWKAGPYRNRTAEAFALRLRAETGCDMVDREHSRVVEPGQLEGASDQAAGRGGR